MSDEASKRVPLPCAACGRPPVASVELEGGQQVNLCWEHLQQHEAMRMRKIEMYRQMAEDAEDQIADVYGVPRPVRPQRIPAPRVNVQQVNIHGDNHGVVNTGTVQSLSNNISIVQGQNAERAAQLKSLAEAILRSATLNDDQKRDAADLLNEVVEDLATPQQQRRPRSVMKSVANGLGQVLSHAADLYALWTALAPHLPI